MDDPEVALPPKVFASVEDPDVPLLPGVPGFVPDSVSVPGVAPVPEGVPGAAAEPGVEPELEVSGVPGAACPEVELSAPLLVPGVDIELSCPLEAGVCSCRSQANSAGKSRKRRVCRFMMVTI
jgi:hypothetical protein